MLGEDAASRLLVGRVAQVGVAMGGGAGPIAQLAVEQAERVMRGDVLGVDGQGPVEGLDGPAQQRRPRLGPPGTPFLLGALEQRLTQLIEDLVVAAEVEPARLQLR